jgi:hypothetical protein
MDGLAILIVEIDGIHEFTVDIELLVKGCAISNADRFTSLITLQMGELKLGNVCLAPNGEHDRQTTVRAP